MLVGLFKRLFRFKCSVLLILAVVNVQGKTTDPNSPAKRNLKGPVKTCTEYTYWMDRGDSLVLVGIEILHYNRKGILTGLDIYHPYPEESSDTISIRNYSNKAGYVEKEVTLRKAGNLLDSFMRIYTLDGNGNVILSVLSDRTGVVEEIRYKYDAGGNEIEQEVNDIRGAYPGTVRRFLSVYDSAGNEIEMTYVDTNGKPGYTNTTEYEGRRPVRITTRNSIENHEQIASYIYDKNGRLIKEGKIINRATKSHMGSDGRRYCGDMLAEEFNKRYAYVGFDKYGNYNKQTIYWDGKLHGVIKRRIVYYSK